MDKELEKYYENYFDMFSRPGWKQFEEEINDSLEDLRLALETSKDTGPIQGQIKELRFFKNFRLMMENAYDHAKEESLKMKED